METFFPRNCILSSANFLEIKAAMIQMDHIVGHIYMESVLFWIHIKNLTI
jgi:hypothetical protein